MLPKRQMQNYINLVLIRRGNEKWFNGYKCIEEIKKTSTPQF